LPDFAGEQWRSMLPPTLRTIFAPDPVKKPAVAKPRLLATVPPGAIDKVTARLRELRKEYPDAEVPQGIHGRWELWPKADLDGNP